ncbi:MAG TPA: efflux RND transporter permease subunit [Thermoanaerobaculia bacterium]|nr:efflux RND transporter permease subunit [Thermoanaerobaculia bacterium]
MALTDLSIRRPVFATVLNLLIVTVGAAAFFSLPVREYPDIDPPIVSITTVYFGASPETIEATITEPIERVVNGVEGIRSISSTSSFGQSSINLEFEAGRDIDIAVTEVNTAVQQAIRELPQEAEQPIITKSRAESQPIIWISLLGEGYSAEDKTDILDRLVRTPLQLLPGVSRVIIGGQREYAMRVWLDPERMAALRVTAGDVRAAIRANNLQVPGGELEGSGRKFTVRVDAQVDDPRVFERLVIRRDGDQVVRIADVGRVELGSANYNTITRSNGEPTIGAGVVRQSTANELEVSRAVRAALPAIADTLPEPLWLQIAIDNSIFVEASLREAFRTLLIVLSLVVLVNLFFLRSLTTTLITAIAIPVSLVGTFALMFLFGFTVNVLTVLALILAIGLLVDDSIVVLENIYRRQELGEGRLRAAFNGSREVVFPVMATTAAVIAVLVPLSAMPGNTGKLFREFAWTMTFAVAFSSLVALTMVPMACSIFLRIRKKHGAVWRGIESLLSRSESAYRSALGFALRQRLVVAIFFALVLAGSWLLFRAMPTDLVPVEDRGQILTMVRAPQGSTAAYTDRAMRQVEDIVLDIPEVERTFAAVALGFGGPPDTSNGIVFSRLKHWDQREVKQQEIVERLFPQYLAIPEALVFAINPPSLGQNSRSADIQVVLKSPDAELSEFAEVGGSLIERMQGIPGLVNVDSDLRFDNPELEVEIDRELAADLGIPVSEIADSIRLLVAQGPSDAFVLRGRQYDVIMALAAEHRAVPDQLRRIHLRAADGQMVPLESLVRLRPGIDAATLNHYDLQRSATVTANLAPGATLGATVPAVLDAAGDLLPAGWSTSLGGGAREFAESSGSLAGVFAVALVIIFLVLAAQFESWVHPLTVMVSVPLAGFGALATLELTGNTLNLYSGIGLVLLIGLVTKNSILLVDFANQERARGTGVREAIRNAGAIRFRPILMTSLTSILGALPLALATGAGAESRRPIGAAIVGGLLFSTFFTLLVIPLVYLAMVRIAERVGLKTIPPLIELETDAEAAAPGGTVAKIPGRATEELPENERDGEREGERRHA